MLCPKCEAENSPNARYCGSCGNPLGLSCSNCGAGIARAQRFCSECGQAAAGAEALGTPNAYTPPNLTEQFAAIPHAIHGERKQVTVLFCDLVGSTALTEQIGAEQMHALLSDFFEVTLECVHQFDGTVNQFLGDGFMALFGAPLALEDHAARAALAAIAIRDKVAERNGSIPIAGWEKVQVRMGLNSGEIVAGAIGDDLRMDYTATGDVTNLAARLEALAAPSEILCGESTVHAAHGAIDTEPLDPVLVKGKAEPIVPYRLLSANPLTARALRTGATFVGRDDEGDMLRGALERVADGHGGTIEIEGEPGVGKSRLVAEFSRLAAAGANIAEGHCISYGRQVPNVPIIDLVRSLCGIETDASEAFVMDALEQAIGISDGSLERDIVDAVGALLGVAVALDRVAAVDPATARGRATQGLFRLLAFASGGAPLVLLIEDLHWADASSLEFLAALSGGLSTLSCLLVVTYRPGSAPTWDTQSRFRHILLEPLGEEHAQALIESLDDYSLLSSDQTDRILARAEGNPFFLEELVRDRAHDSEDVLGDVFDVLSARIDRLEAGDKDLLRTASVIGRKFEADLLEDISGRRAQIRPALERLLALGFIESAGRGSYAFVHALTQEVAYRGMLDADAKALHSAVGERLAGQARSAEDRCEAIAGHYLEGLVPSRAIDFLETSVHKAIRGHAVEDALGFFNQILPLLENTGGDPESVSRRVELILEMFPAFHHTHRNFEYERLIERYMPDVDALGQSPLRGPFLAQRGHRLWTSARYDEAVDVLNESAAVCAETTAPAGALHAEVMLSWTHGYRGDFELAAHHGHEALRFCRTLPVPLFECYAHIGLLLSHIMRGQWQAAQTHGEAARNIGVAARDDGLASFGGTFLSMVATSRGDAAKGFEIAQRGLDEAPTDYFRGWAAAYMAWAMSRMGQVTEALPILEQATVLPRDSHHISGYLFNGPLLVEARLATGDVTGARQLADALRGHSVKVGVPFVAVRSEILIGEIDLVEARPADALEHFQKAVEESKHIGAEDAWCHARFGEGRALAAIDDNDGARIALKEALVACERLGTKTLPDRVRAALGAIA